ncbi:hypothetical protein ABW20_dc0108834 [Dactylellina cionopaga]|nr:hypothetical protein ABW20_dc0108834 [Dactylellina cionopaga]
MSSSCCNLRKTQHELTESGNSYNQNFRNFFCEGERYDAEHEHGTMYQCLLGACCGEDWFHDRCILEENPEVRKSPAQNSQYDSDLIEDEHETLTGFPDEASFEYFICWKCVSGNPWLLNYIGSPGFLEPVIRNCAPTEQLDSKEGEKVFAPSRKRKASAISSDDVPGSSNKQSTVSGKDPTTFVEAGGPKVYTLESENISPTCTLPRRAHPELAGKKISLFLSPDFRDHVCRCNLCLEVLRGHTCLLEDEPTYEPPLDSDAAESNGRESLLDAGEKALNTIDRVRAIEGVLAYNMLKEKVKEFLQPFAEERRIVCKEDVKKYFKELKEDSSSTKQKPSSDGEL